MERSKTMISTMLVDQTLTDRMGDVLPARITAKLLKTTWTSVVLLTDWMLVDLTLTLERQSAFMARLMALMQKRRWAWREVW